MTHDGSVPGSGRLVLLVEDDARIRRVLGISLRREGHRVVEVETGEAALEAMQHENVDVVVLDLMLPGIDGFEVCRRLRRSSEVPVIVVSALDSSQDIVDGLEAGADDYVVKPVVARVLVARIRALLRRARLEPLTEAPVFAGDLEVRPAEGIVLRAGAVVQLTVTELRLLVELAWRLGLPVSRESLLEHVWGYDYFGDTRLVDVHISRLRQKIEADPRRPARVLTVRGLGYKLVP